MIKKRRLFGLLFLVVFTGNAFAYLDPGTMTLIYQMLVAIFVASLMAIKTFWITIKEFFNRIFSKNEKSD